MSSMELATLEKLHEQYKSFKSSVKSEKIGTETEPAWDNSPANELLSKMLETISGCLSNVEKASGEYNRLLAMQGALYYQHAKVLVQIDQSKKAQDVLKTCIDFLKDSLLIPEVTFLGLRVLNHYCYLLTKVGDFDKSQDLLEHAEKKYLELKSENCMESLLLYSNDDLFEAKLELTPNKEVNEKLERLVTNNLQMLGYVYNKQGDLDKFALYHHQVLTRQLEMREGDAIVWAMKTARLGYFFLTQSKFRQARHHLAAASYVLGQYENILKTLETTDAVLSKWDELNHRYADIAKCWVRYGLFLFNASKMNLVSAFYDDTSDIHDNSWTNVFDNFIYGGSGGEESEDNGIWHGSVGKGRNDELRSTFAATNLKDLEIANGGVTGPGSGPKSRTPKEPTSPASSSVAFDVIFESSSHGDSAGGVGQVQSASATESESEGKADGDRDDGKEEDEEEEGEEEEGEKTGEDDGGKDGGKCETAVPGDTGANDGKSPSTGDDEAGGRGDEVTFRFPNLDLSCFEKCVSCCYVDSLASARALFLFTYSWLKKSKLFYTLKDHPMEYVNVILDLSELYRYLAFYEDDIENQYSIQRMRADTLERLSVILKELRPQCYIGISIEIFRELAEIHLELMGLNLRRLYAAGPEEGGGPASGSGSGPGSMPGPGEADDTQPRPNTSPAPQNPSADYSFHKIEAVADIYQRLYQFSEIFGHGALGDFDSVCAMPSFDNDIHDDSNFPFESYQKSNMKLF